MKFKFAISVVAVLAAMTAVSCGNNKNSSAKSEDKSAEAAATAVQADERGYVVKVGDQVPDFDLQMLDGTTLNIKELQGKVVMLQFTASWCCPLRHRPEGDARGDRRFRQGHSRDLSPDPRP